MLNVSLPTGTQRGLLRVQTDEPVTQRVLDNVIRRELGAMKESINNLTTEVRDLRVSVHGFPDLNIAGIETRIKKLEDRQMILVGQVTHLEQERDEVRGWLRGATWSMTALLTILTIGGGVSVTSILRLLQQIAELPR